MALAARLSPARALLAAVLAAAPSAPIGAQEDPREGAQRRFAETTMRENAARLELWRAHNEHHALWEHMLGNEREGALEKLGAAVSAALGSAQERSEIEEPARAALISAGVGGLASVDLAPRLAAAIASGLRQDPASDRSALARAALEKLYPAEGAWIDAWNGGLAGACAAAKAYSAAREERLLARKALLGAISPAAAHPAAKQTPDGMVLVPGGSYTVGPAKGWTTGVAASARAVELKSFYIDRFEVTNEQYRVFLGSMPVRKAEPFYPSTWLTNEEGQPPTIPEGRDDHPVTGVDLVAAMAYAAWRDARLPTEEEWEIAAAGPLAQEYPWGEGFETGRANALDHLRGLTARVGEFGGDLSQFGAFDLAGNVCEWTASLPTGEVLKKAPAEGQIKNVICRGGSFLTEDPRETLSTHYRWPQPARGTQRSDLGFRCAKSARSR